MDKWYFVSKQHDFQVGEKKFESLALAEAEIDKLLKTKEEVVLFRDKEPFAVYYINNGGRKYHRIRG